MDGGASPLGRCGTVESPDAVRGAAPLAHAECTVIKLHGDYLDARIRNTTDELAQYDRETSRLLNRVLDEYGLVVETAPG